MAYESSQTQWDGWSDWIWNTDYQRYYRQRQTADGNVDYEWHNDGPTSVAETTHTAQTPRDSAVDEISQNLQSTHLQGPSPTSNYSSQSGKYTISTSSSKPKSSSTSKSRSSTSKHKSSSSRSKGKSRVYEDDEYDEGEETERETPQASSSRQSASRDQAQQYGDPEAQQYYQTEATRSSYPTSAATTYDTTSTRIPSSTTAQASQSQHYGQSRYDKEEEDPDLDAAIAASKGYNYGAHSAGESSASAAYGKYAYDNEPQTSTRSATASYITGTEGDQEHLDPRYRVEHSNKFQPGEIFKVLWSEPQGGGDGPPSVSDRFEARDKYGGRIFVGFRRFIVIANDQGHCTCIPIFTYSGKGCNKRGIKPEKHGIIHERGQKAKLLPSEPKLGFAPVRIEIYQDGEKLSKESRVNYSKLITVEHNVKVFFIGRITASDWDIVSEAVNKCWEDKTHHKKKHR